MPQAKTSRSARASATRAGARRKKVGFRFSSTVQPKHYGGAANLKGSKNTQAKLTEAKVKIARRLHRQGTKIKVLARRFGVDASTMSLAVRRLTFRHVR